MRLLFFTHAGTNSRDIFLDMATGFERAGHEVVRWELEPMVRVYRAGSASRASVIQSMTSMVAEFISANGIDMSVGMWANAIGALAPGRKNGRLASSFDMIENPHLMFWLDAPHWAAGGGMQELFGSPLVGGPFVRSVVNNAGIAREMTEVLGFSSALGRRYGINEEVFRPRPEVRPAYDIVFGGGPGDGRPSELMLAELESDDPDVDAIRRERAARVGAKLDESAAEFGPDADAMTELFRALLERRLGPPGTPMLEDLAALAASGHAEAVGRLTGDPRAFVRVSARLRSIDAWRRAFTITYLARRAKCAMFGAATLDGWPCPAKMLGDLPYAEMSRAYASGRIGLNAMRWQDDIGLNLKPYEITASGACLLCDGRVGFDEVFVEGVEAASYQTPGQAWGRARELLADDAGRRAMAAAGRARTLRDHTWTAAADELIAYATAAAPEAAAA
jgi:hypothetical protein